MKYSVINEIDFEFCPRCGSRFQKNLENSLLCAQCGLEYFVNPRPCNAILILNDQNEILLTRRAFDPGKGLWDVPGGFVGTNETFEDSIIREAREELSVEIGSIRYLRSGYDRYVYKGLNYHTVGFVCTAQIVSGELRPNDDVSEIRFFRKDDIPWKDIAFPIITKTLKECIQSHPL